MIADPDLDALFYQRLRDFRLDVGEADDEIRLEVEDTINLGAGESRDARLFAARSRGTHGETGDADDPICLPQRVKNFGRLLGEANDARRISAHHASLEHTLG